MASNREDNLSFLEDRNQPQRNTSVSDPLGPTYVEGTPSREVLLRSPPLQDMSAITTEPSLGGGDVSSSREQLQIPNRGNRRPNYGGPSRDFSYEGPSYGYTSNSSTSGLGIRSNDISRANINTTPLVSTFTRNTNIRDIC